MEKKDFSQYSKMQILNRPKEMPEIQTSKQKEQAITCATHPTCNTQKDNTPKQENKEVQDDDEWKLNPKRFF